MFKRFAIVPIVLVLLAVFGAPGRADSADGFHCDIGLGYYADSLIGQGMSGEFNFTQTTSNSYYAIDGIASYREGQLEIGGLFGIKYANEFYYMNVPITIPEYLLEYGLYFAWYPMDGVVLKAGKFWSTGQSPSAIVSGDGYFICTRFSY